MLLSSAPARLLPPLLERRDLFISLHSARLHASAPSRYTRPAYRCWEEAGLRQTDLAGGRRQTPPCACPDSPRRSSGWPQGGLELQLPLAVLQHARPALPRHPDGERRDGCPLAGFPSDLIQGEGRTVRHLVALYQWVYHSHRAQLPRFNYILPVQGPGSLHLKTTSSSSNRMTCVAPLARLPPRGPAQGGQRLGLPYAVPQGETSINHEAG